MRTCHKFMFFESELVMRWSHMSENLSRVYIFLVRTGHEVES